MISPDAWTDRSAVVDHLARQLIKGRLALFLGAGVSQFYGLPTWTDLVNRLCDLHGEKHAAAGREIMKIGALKEKHFKDDDTNFNAEVKAELYRGLTIDFQSLRDNHLLAAIGALLMASKRGSASEVITLNYDDLVEIYLEFHGLMTDAVSKEMHWQSNADVTIYHPHGLLSLDPKRGDSEEIVFGAADYQRIMRPESIWRSKLLSILRSHTTIYIGLSGGDDHLQSLSADIHKTHVINRDRYAYHGVRFTVDPADDDVSVVLNGYGVSTFMLPNWADLANFLFEVCQAARLLRLKEM